MLLQSSWSSFDFFSTGLVTAAFCGSGRMPSRREVLHIMQNCRLQMHGSSWSMNSCSRNVGRVGI